MKAFLSLTVVSSAVLLLTACASTGTAYEKAPVRHESVVTDNVYVAVVEHIAKQRGTQVVWVNAPKKRVAEPVASAE
jgi:outer membrane biogenesis lipoprotein LolB